MDKPIAYVDSDVESLTHVFNKLKLYYDLSIYDNPIKFINEVKGKSFSMIITKDDLKPLNGLELLHKANQIVPNTLKILLLQKGCSRKVKSKDFYTLQFTKFKNIGSRIIKKYIDSFYYPNVLMKEDNNEFPIIIGNHPLLMEQFKYARKIAPYMENVLITGETGTGKDLFARFIHWLSDRKSGPFHIVNCASINPTLFESEFFGHKKGAYTGAIESQEGHFTKAHNGMLVLDEISDIDIVSQAKLLRAIENQEFYPVGSRKVCKVNTRIVTVTNKNLRELVQKGKFRRDLFHRLNIFNLHLPSLKDRIDDVESLAKYFFLKFSNKYLFTQKVDIQEEIFPILKKYDYKGNIRELESIVYKVFALKNSINGKFTVKDFQDFITDIKNNGVKKDKDISLKNYLYQVQKRKVLEALVAYQFNISRTARHLGMSRQNLQHLIKKFNFKPDFDK